MRRKRWQMLGPDDPTPSFGVHSLSYDDLADTRRMDVSAACGLPDYDDLANTRRVGAGEVEPAHRDDRPVPPGRSARSAGLADEELELPTLERPAVRLEDEARSTLLPPGRRRPLAPEPHALTRALQPAPIPLARRKRRAASPPDVAPPEAPSADPAAEALPPVEASGQRASQRPGARRRASRVAFVVIPAGLLALAIPLLATGARSPASQGEPAAPAPASATDHDDERAAPATGSPARPTAEPASPAGAPASDETEPEPGTPGTGDRRTALDLDAIPTEGPEGRDRQASDAAVARARELRAAGRLDAAETAYRYAAELDRGNPHPAIELARLLVDRGRFERAAEQAERAVELRDGRQHYRLVLGDALHGAGDVAAARRVWHAALEAGPTVPGVAARLRDRLADGPRSSDR